MLCRILSSAGNVFFYEVVDLRKQGIADEDLDKATNPDAGMSFLDGYYLVSAQIETKLRKNLGNSLRNFLGKTPEKPPGQPSTPPEGTLFLGWTNPGL